jgi:micrococcal nuclease
MKGASPWAASRARRKRSRFPVSVLLLALLMALLMAAWAAAGVSDAGLAPWNDFGRALPFPLTDALIVGAVVVLVALAQLTGMDRLIWHLTANATAFETPLVLRQPWVIDGDTVDDSATGVRYRLAHIDAPETGDNAKCFNENQRGLEAKREAIRLIRSAGVVSVRRTWRFDRFGRRVAFVLVDGRDLGELLLAAGLARPWPGHRRKWCGPNGGLAKIAQSGVYHHACTTCRHWR